MVRWSAALLAAFLVVTFPLQIRAAEQAFHWEAPDTATGDWVVRFEMDLPEPTWCTFTTHAAGRIAGPGLNLFVESSTGAGSRDSGKPYGSVHADGTGTTVGTASGVWVRGSSIYGVFDPGQQWLIVAFGTETYTAWDGTRFLPLTVDVACDGPFALGLLEGSREAFAIHVWTPRDGIGASAYPYGAFNLGDSVSRTLASPRVEFLARDDSTGYTSLRVDHPGGTASWTTLLGDGWEIAGDPGAWNVTVDRVSAGNSFVGLFLGLRDLASLDELV